MGELLTSNAKELSFFYGMTSISMDKLAYQAGKTRKKIHPSFGEQKELTNKIIDDLLEYQLLAFKECHETAIDVIDEVIKQSNEPFKAWASINQTFFLELQGSIPEPWQKLDLQVQHYIRPLIILNLEKGIQEKLYHDLDISFTADLRLHQLTHALDPAVFTERRMSMSELFMELTRFYLQGITTEKGKKILYKYSITSNENK